MGRQTQTATAGDPESNQRAEMRVGDGDAGGGGGGGHGQPSKPRTLYERLGGEKTITALVDDAAQRVMADPRVNFDRTNVKTNWLGGHYKPWQASDANVETFKKHMVEFLTLASGGPSEYSGRDMPSVHKGMRISNSEFDAFVGDFKTAMDRQGLANAEKKDLLAVVETTRKEIVEKQ
jgi:hemoglobin